MSVVLSPQQEEAYDKAGAWLNNRDKPFFKLHGYAGTGKSTIAEQIAQQHSGPVVYMTYTGRAAQVLRKKGVDCRTIHSYIYLPASEKQQEAQEHEDAIRALEESGEAPTKTGEQERQREIRKHRARLEELYKPDFSRNPEVTDERGDPIKPFKKNTLIVCDEMSMVGKQEAEDLLSFGMPILVLGDPGQLPPIEGRGYFNSNPDYMLTEIHRQAKESPIIRLAMMAREGKSLPRGQHGTSSVISKASIDEKIALGVEQLAVGSNKSRLMFNQEIRKLRGYKGVLPVAGERLMCLRNNGQIPLFNGEIFTCVEDASEEASFVQLVLKGDDDHQFVVDVHRECFTDPDLLKSWSYAKRKRANEFTYSYAATIHKLQGGQFESVLVYPDMFTWPSAKADYRRLLYTGISRAIDRVVVAL